MAYGIGIDIGIKSVGMATVELNASEEPIRIMDLNVKIFDEAENPKDGSSLALPRRLGRGVRRRGRRHKHRLERIKELLIEKNFISYGAMEALYSKNGLEDIYFLRTTALDEKKTNEDLTRILIHISQRRGFKSNRKNPTNEEDGKLLTAVKENEKRMTEKGYRTVGEMLYKDQAFSVCKRNKGEDYKNTVARSMIKDEAEKIIDAQFMFGNKLCNEAFKQEYLDILLSQRAFDEGPGKDSPYGGNQIEKMIGKCTFEPEEKRAAKATYTFEYFTLLHNINNISIISDGYKRGLNNEEKEKVYNLAFKSDDVNYFKIRKELGLNEGAYFNNVKYGGDRKDREATEKKSKFNFLSSYHKCKKAFSVLGEDYFDKMPVEKRDLLGYAITVNKTDDKIAEYLRNNDFSAEETEAALTLQTAAKFGHLSIKACRNIIPYMEKGMTYTEACEAIGYTVKSEAKDLRKYLPYCSDEINDITNPVVKRALSQTIKVLNAVIRKNGSPSYITVELARELSQSYKDRKESEKENDTNADKNAHIKKIISENYGIPMPSGQDIVKYKLWEEQGGICPYSLRSIQAERIFETGYAEIDHIIPYSICFDNSYKNKVLVFSEENRQKGNRIPMEYLSGKRKDDAIVWINANIKNFKKKQRLLKAKLTEEDVEGFKDRNLNDTRYASRFLYNYILKYLEFAPSKTGKKVRVKAVNGAVTAYLRGRWGISKIRENGDMHHAVDALVVACSTQGMVQKISQYSKNKELEFSKLKEKTADEKTNKFPQPWDLFRKELEIRLSNDVVSLLEKEDLYNYRDVDIYSIKPVFVSRMANHKVKGKAHKDTIKSAKYLESEGIVVSKKSLAEIKLDKYGEIAGYFRPSDDRLLYEALKKRLSDFNNDAVKAFEEEFHKPTSSGKEGPIVKKVKIQEKAGNGIILKNCNGFVSNDAMVRLDIFHVENDGYYMVPIYVADTVKKELPDKAVVAGGKPWKKMKEEDFIFSLYPRDLVKITTKENKKFSLVNKKSTLPKEYEAKEFLVYYNGANVNSGCIGVILHDNTYGIGSLGLKTLKSIEKYNVDMLGNVTKCKKEKRRSFKIGHKLKEGE